MAGGWTVLMAIDAAQQAGEDWGPGAAAAGERLADVAERRRAGCIPRLVPVADPGRRDAAPGEP